MYTEDYLQQLKHGRNPTIHPWRTDKQNIVYIATNGTLLSFKKEENPDPFIFNSLFSPAHLSLLSFVLGSVKKLGGTLSFLPGNSDTSLSLLGVFPVFHHYLRRVSSSPIHSNIFLTFHQTFTDSLLVEALQAFSDSLLKAFQFLLATSPKASFCYNSISLPGAKICSACSWCLNYDTPSPVMWLKIISWFLWIRKLRVAWLGVPAQVTSGVAISQLVELEEQWAQGRWGSVLVWGGLHFSLSRWSQSLSMRSLCVD